MTLVDLSHLLEVYLIFETEESGDERLIGIVSNKERAERFRQVEGFTVRDEIVNPLDGSYLAMREKEVMDAEK